MVDWLKEFSRRHKIKVKYMRCDNANENHYFMHEVKQYITYTIQFEFTAPNTPQQNGRVERKFATLYGKIRSLMNAANLPKVLCQSLWAHAALLVTQLENILSDNSNKSSSVKRFGHNPPWSKN